MTLIDPDDFDEVVSIVCENCGESGDVPAEWEGMSVECKSCENRFLVPEAP